MARQLNVKSVGLIGGIAAALAVLLFADLEPGNTAVTRTAAVAVLMAVWWVTEAIPIPATALLPVVLFPLLGIMKGKSVAPIYFNHVIFLFIGGFIVALAMQKWNLHKRIALRIILLIGTSPKRIILGFMVATWFLSMWISNTATTMMMVPMAVAIILKLRETFGREAVSRFAVGLLLGIAYSASVGGTATLIGTPPNLAFARIYQIYFPDAPEISFAAWLLFALPFAFIFLIIVWGLIVRLFVWRQPEFRAERSVFRDEYRQLGRISYEERSVLVLFILLAALWMFRADIDIGAFTIPGWSNLLPTPEFIDDGTIAVAIATLLFLIPSRSRQGRLMDWETATQVHWGIVHLFGGGFALASGFRESGLSEWLGVQLTGLSGFPPLLLVASVCLLITFLTELTSNTATTQMVLPILGSLAASIHVHPLLLMIPATLSASCAFMLPVATPPNAIVFGTGDVRMSHMMRTGIFLNLIGVVLVTSAIYLVGRFVFGFDPGQFPDWAVMR
ncbi:MAG: SLC13 family permease [Candidatus Zixiibacteriota bacterium]